MTQTTPELGTRPAAGTHFPDLELPDHTCRRRRLSELAGGDPLILVTSRGWWCPKEQRYLRELVHLQDELEVAYARLVVLSVDPPEVQAAFRAGLGARFPFLSDADRHWLDRLGLRESTDTVHHPYRPAAFALFPDLLVHSAYNGYCGAVTVTRSPLRFADDPFARLFPGTAVRTSLFADVLPPSGPPIERYSGAAWPGGEFESHPMLGAARLPQPAP